jgi:hypothetical protein
MPEGSDEQVAVSREEHLAAIARLDNADSELRASIVATERALRTDYEDKIAGAVLAVKDDIIGVRTAMSVDVGNVRDDVKDVQDHLTWQDRLVGGGLFTGGITFAVLLVLQFTQHIFG